MITVQEAIQQAKKSANITEDIKATATLDGKYYHVSLYLSNMTRFFTIDATTGSDVTLYIMF